MVLIGLEARGNGEVLVKGYRLLVRRCISSGDLVFGMLIIDDTVLYT